MPFSRLKVACNENVDLRHKEGNGFKHRYETYSEMEQIFVMLVLTFISRLSSTCPQCSMHSRQNVTLHQLTDAVRANCMWFTAQLIDNCSHCLGNLIYSTMVALMDIWNGFPLRILFGFRRLSFKVAYFSCFRDVLCLWCISKDTLKSFCFHTSTTWGIKLTCQLAFFPCISLDKCPENVVQSASNPHDIFITTLILT